MTEATRCDGFFGTFHRYGKWQLVDRCELHYRDGTKGRAGEQITQKRVCERCGFEDWHTKALIVGWST